MKRHAHGTHYVLQMGSYPPRECGIATFTQDLTAALNKRFNPIVKTRVLALNDQPTSMYNYPSNVFRQIAATELEAYVHLAQEVNRRNEVKIVNIQHEFGIFGGEWGNYLIPFLQAIEKPVVVTFHSVLSGPDAALRGVVRSIANLSRALIVMNAFSGDILVKEYAVPRSKIAVIPHGIPQIPFESSERAKAELDLTGRTVLSTFGMISVNKGLQYALRALPKVVKQFPDIVYLIVGATHPAIRRSEGESYRNFLAREVERLHIGDHVRFYNKYVTLEEIIQYLRATDVYIAPTIDQGQSVSGTLAYAVGAGRPVVSTATAYAHYLIDDANGILVPPKNHLQIAKGLEELLSDRKRMKSMGAVSYEKSRHMIWPNVAAQYFDVYRKFADVTPEENKLPDITLAHLVRMTDEFGILHHAKYGKPAPRYGYSVDDNARALIVAVRRYKTNPGKDLLALLKTYLRFVKFNARPDGSFSNIVSPEKKRDTTRDEDVWGRAVWALGSAASAEFLPPEVRRTAEAMFMRSLQHAAMPASPRAAAFAMSGLYAYLVRFPKRNLTNLFRRFADKQIAFYKTHTSRDWNWFEDQLTYSNSKLPESLFYAYDLLRDKKYLNVATATLDFLSAITFLEKHYAPIGQNGWYYRNQQRSYFDQQPEDAGSMVETKVVAYKVTGNARHLDDAFRAFQWFLGKNHLTQMVYDEVTGGCHDGVGQYGMNLNQGAESTLSYLLARLALDEVARSPEAYAAY